jgi:hypothetical protein
MSRPTLVGTYADPKHGGCVRTIEATRQPRVFLVRGAYGEDEAARPGHPWTATAHVAENGRHVTVDFHDKRTQHERIYHALWCPVVRELHWEDGSAWKRLYAPWHPE